ncbi:MAG: amidase family protein [Phycisphaeraceae bacterium]
MPNPTSPLAAPVTVWLTAVLALMLAAMPTRGAEFEFEEATIAEVHEAMRQGQLTAVELVTSYLERIDRLDRPMQLNAIVLTNPRALDEAAARDVHLAETGELVGPMHGVPVIVKDNYDTVGLPSTAGSAAMAGYVANDDAFQIKRLRAAGAIVLAKSNMGEWAINPFRNISSTLGETRNYYDTDYPVAGSSGGTAVALAANLGLVGLGTDTGSSIRGPASHLALVGLRPTIGLTSRAGIIPQHHTRDVGGPMARTVEDTARLLDVIAGFDPDDPMTEHAAGHIPPSYVDGLDANTLAGARIGVLRVLSDAETADPEIRELFEQALADLEAAGAELVDPFDVPQFEELSADLWCNRFQYDLDRFLAQAHDPPIRSLREVVESGQHTEHIAGPLRDAVAVTAAPHEQDPPCADHLTDPRRVAFREAIERAMDEANIAAVAYPTWSNRPRPIADPGGPFGNNSSRIAPHTGQPAITVPMGFLDNGLPAGLQLLGRLFDEPVLLNAAYGYEQATHHREQATAEAEP